MPDPVTRLNAALEGRYRIESELGEGGMARLPGGGPQTQAERRTSARSAMVVDPTVTPPQVDSLGLSVLFVSLSPDERWLAYQNQGAVGVFVEPWPARSERFAIDPLAVDPQWRSSTELIYYTARDRDGGTFHRVSIDASANPPVGATAVWKIDPLFADTDGPSFALSPDGNLVYRRSMDQNRGYYVRVVPAWVERMKRAVDEANR